MRFTVDRLDHIVLNVQDVEITASWYQRVLGMEREDFGADLRTALKFGGQKINLRPADADLRQLGHRRQRRPGGRRHVLHLRRRAGGGGGPSA